MAVPLVIIHFRLGFSQRNHPAIGDPPWQWKPPCTMVANCFQAAKAEGRAVLVASLGGALLHFLDRIWIGLMMTWRHQSLPLQIVFDREDHQSNGIYHVINIHQYTIWYYKNVWNRSWTVVSSATNIGLWGISRGNSQQDLRHWQGCNGLVDHWLPRFMKQKVIWLDDQLPDDQSISSICKLQFVHYHQVRSKKRRDLLAPFHHAQRRFLAQNSGFMSVKAIFGYTLPGCPTPLVS